MGALHSTRNTKLVSSCYIVQGLYYLRAMPHDRQLVVKRYRLFSNNFTIKILYINTVIDLCTLCFKKIPDIF